MGISAAGGLQAAALHLPAAHVQRRRHDVRRLCCVGGARNRGEALKKWAQHLHLLCTLHTNELASCPTVPWCTSSLPRLHTSAVLTTKQSISRGHTMTSAHTSSHSVNAAPCIPAGPAPATAEGSHYVLPAEAPSPGGGAVQRCGVAEDECAADGAARAAGAAAGEHQALQGCLTCLTTFRRHRARQLDDPSMAKHSARERRGRLGTGGWAAVGAGTATPSVLQAWD